MKCEGVITHLVFEQMPVHQHAVLVRSCPDIIFDHLFVDTKVSIRIKVVVLKINLVSLLENNCDREFC